MDRIQEMLDRLAELSDEELGQLEGTVLSEFDTVEKLDQSPETVEQMVGLADALDTVRGELGRRTEQMAELSKRAEEAVARVRAQSEPAEEVSEEETPVAEEEAEQPLAVAAAAETPEEPVKQEGNVEQGSPELAVDGATNEDDDDKATEPAPASGDTSTGQEGTVTAAAATSQDPEPTVQAPADRAPVARVTYEAPVAITAGADIPGVSAGSPLSGMKDIAKAMADRMHQMRRTSGGDGEQHTVATLTASFPEERVLKSADPEGNTEKLKNVLGPQAITAAGGICAPLQVNYDLYDVGSVTDRPVKDALGVFNADRGGIRFMTPPLLGDLAGAVSLWTLQDDIDAATPGAPDPVKPCIRVGCGEEISVYTDAIPLCLTFGNLGARAYPELVARHNELAMVQHARFAETRLLTRIGVLSTAVTARRELSAAVDFLGQVDRAQATYRNRHRLNSVSPMRVIAPQWLKELMRADLSMRMPGDGLESNLMVADATINRFFAARNINVTWTLDGETGQIFGLQEPGELLDFPDNVVWYMFAEGTFLFLDGGTLDLGLVRDSTLNGTNDYKMFLETFEGVAKVGIESLRITSRLERTGQVAGTVDTTPAA